MTRGEGDVLTFIIIFIQAIRAIDPSGGGVIYHLTHGVWPPIENVRVF